MIIVFENIDIAAICLTYFFDRIKLLGLGYYFIWENAEGRIWSQVQRLVGAAYAALVRKRSEVRA
jgi:hypothetical protein